MAVLLLGLFPVQAQAHRNGCHRWHSCPSDSGSYVCGDLGYDTYCPGADGSGGSSATDSVDVTAPDMPKVADVYAGAGGKVHATVTAERGSRIEVQEDDPAGWDSRTVAHATATGGAQVITFTADSGSHAYTVTATDVSGNTSDPSSQFTVDVDADAPDISGFAVTGPDAETATARVKFASSEAGGNYRLTVDGRKEHFSGKVRAAGEELGFDLGLPNGSYTARLTITDEAGNARHASTAFRVDIARLVPSLHVEAAPRAHRVQFTVTAPPRSRGTLTVTDSIRRAFTTDADGSAVISVDLPDGNYPAPVAKVTDPYGRTGTGTARPLVIDTIAPALKVTADSHRARYGELTLAVATEAGAEVTVAYRSGADQSFPAFTATGPTATTVRRAVSPATYTVTVTATDGHGNSTVRRLSVRVDDHWTTGEWLAFLLILLLVTALIVGVLVIRRRTRPARQARRARREAERAELERRTRQQREVREYQAATERYERAVHAWEREREQLVRTAEYAAELADGDGAGQDWSDAWGRRKRGEAVRWVTDSEMVEPASDGSSVNSRDTGALVVTDQRVLFIGKTKREWQFAKLQRVEHSGGTTWMQVSNRTRLSGVRYDRTTEETRVAIELAIADAPPGEAPQLGSGPATVLARVRQAIAIHDRDRPRPPRTPEYLRPTDAGNPVR